MNAIAILNHINMNCDKYVIHFSQQSEIDL